MTGWEKKKVKMNDNPDLIIYKIGEDQSPSSIRWADFLDSKNEATSRFFIQALSPKSEQLQHWLKAVDADPLIMDRCIDTDIISGAFFYERMVMLKLPLIKHWQSARHAEITIICLKNTLIILGEEFLFPRNSFLPNELFLSMCRQMNITGMLFALLDGLIDHSSDLTLQMRRAVDKLENDMLDCGGEFGKRLLDYNRDLAHFEIALEAKHRTLTALLTVETPPIDQSTIHEPLRDVIAHIEHSQRYVDRIEDRLSELQHHVTLILQEKTNQRLRILTVLTAIFMPLTLLAGIYGMNFRHMPELYWRYGYPLVLFIMLGIAIGLLSYFAKKGWFR